MKHMTSVIHTLGIATFLFFFPLFAQETLIDDFTDGDNLNALTGEWAYYDDAIGSGKNERLQAKQDVGIQGSQINVGTSFKQLPSGGFDYDTKVYSFEAQNANGEQYAYMPFTFGGKWQDSAGAIEAFVGLRTSLSADGEPLDLTAKTGVKFKLKTTSHNLNVTFMIETSDIEADSMYAYYQRTVNVTKETWNDITVPIAGLTQPLWTPDSAKKAFDPSKAVRLSWQVSLSNNPGLEEMASDELAVDDIFLLDQPISVERPKQADQVHQSAFTTFYRNGVLQFEGGETSLSTITTGMVSLIDSRGRVVLTRTIAGAQKSVSGNHLPNGLYVARINGSLSNGKTVSMHSPLFITQ